MTQAECNLALDLLRAELAGHFQGLASMADEVRRSNDNVLLAFIVDSLIAGRDRYLRRKQEIQQSVPHGGEATAPLASPALFDASIERLSGISAERWRQLERDRDMGRDA